MPIDIPALDLLPDVPLSPDAVGQFESEEGICRAVPVAIKSTNSTGFEPPHVDDIILATQREVLYVTRSPGNGWEIEHSEEYEVEDQLTDTIESVTEVAEHQLS
ncbi:hypothetical protein KU306_16300 (plasmid) [Haloferax larsenii]|uniref:DUF7964 domain-containing protein n=1 Tax=Haloferax larsenii TaxID=302484 RepID=A0ABY5RME4_HALLR|nr:hypothetical protein [Haloferax larsenii]ELZ79113.1 hypothetical protein C455_09518 [Haloferax larsenii JCM 13917]UVE52173.1 hypothetical protein KU306_16300 [Haloferax larsenii]